jgi:hypothetical protein
MSKSLKYDVLNLLAKNMAFFAATQWLKCPKEEFGGKNASELMKEGKHKKVYAQLKKELGEV